MPDSLRVPSESSGLNVHRDFRCPWTWRNQLLPGRFVIRIQQLWRDQAVWMWWCVGIMGAVFLLWGFSGGQRPTRSSNDRLVVVCPWWNEQLDQVRHSRQVSKVVQHLLLHWDVRSHGGESLASKQRAGKSESFQKPENSCCIEAYAARKVLPRNLSLGVCCH